MLYICYMKAIHLFYHFCIIIFSTKSYAQEGLPIYSDYLTDNFYLLYPSMAGASNCTKVRLLEENSGWIKMKLQIFKQSV